MVTFKHKHALPLFASLGITLTVTFTFTQILSYGKSSFAQISLSQNTEVSAGEENWWWWIPSPWYSVLSGDSSFWYKVSHCISAFEIASFWHDILGWTCCNFFSWPMKENIDKRILKNPAVIRLVLLNILSISHHQSNWRRRHDIKGTTYKT